MSRLDPSATRVTLRPRFFDRLCVFFLVLPGLVTPFVAVLSALPRPPTTLHCDRATQACSVFFPSLWGGDRYRYDLGDFKTSRVVADHDGALVWKIERGTGPLWIGEATKQDPRIKEYRRLAGDFEAFLLDPSRTTFDASVAAAGGAPWPVLIIIGLVLCYFGFRWWRGWYAELELDPAAREITIHRRPMLFTGPRTKKLAASELRLAEAVENRYIGRGQRAKFARIELRDQAGKLVFRYTTLYDTKSRAVLDGYMKLLAGFFTGR